MYGMKSLLFLGALLLCQVSLAQQDCGTVSDHEGNRYKTVRIGTQCWMAENMRCKTSPSTGANILECPAVGYSYSGKKAYYYEDNPGYATEGYGLLYNWCASVDTFNVSLGETSTNTSYDQTSSAIFAGNRRGICPEGWHIPSDSEWDTLIRYVSGQQEYRCNGYTAYIAKALASTEGWGCVPCDPNGIAEFLDPNTGTSISLDAKYDPTSKEKRKDVFPSCAVVDMPSGNNATGFSALPLGGYSTHGFYGREGFATFWSATQLSGSYFYAHAEAIHLYYREPNISQHSNNKCFAKSVRCIRDVDLD